LIQLVCDLSYNHAFFLPFPCLDLTICTTLVVLSYLLKEDLSTLFKEDNTPALVLSEEMTLVDGGNAKNNCTYKCAI